jgi:hypothetical protein
LKSSITDLYSELFSAGFFFTKVTLLFGFFVFTTFDESRLLFELRDLEEYPYSLTSLF